jgi:hypothetical protein
MSSQQNILRRSPSFRITSVGETPGLFDQTSSDPKPPGTGQKKPLIPQGLNRWIFHNSTTLDTARIESLCTQAVQDYRTNELEIRIRYARSADFSGSCYYNDARIYINIGKHLSYPYQMGTYIAPAKTRGNYWTKPIFTIKLTDPYQLILFIFLHECFHWLVKLAGRNTRQKESMCDRFAARELHVRYAAPILDERNRPVPMSAWDIHDLDRFIAKVRRPQAAGPTDQKSSG